MSKTVQSTSFIFWYYLLSICVLDVRATYKDLVWLLQRNSLIDLASLKAKLERSFMNDQLIKGKTLDRGRNYQEVREYQSLVSSFIKLITSEIHNIP